ncbi:hypothetical protein DEU56DRAFT_795478 [Suillus clintonianus]|uniref:uncharacterized protein n=1 Tax=Suillus clintonianus TaxID=1904413 RepID=UPI001B871B42|nr:uncharacterized protein DEU56DRAFT_795478 [Suillus clintonianus]KAG2141907.1 hypothetical protein DEU56DRAFT_795478 [Suillus clintonianus]
MSSLTPLKASIISLKPHRNEAALRIRNSSAALIALLFLTHLTPAPSLWTAIDVVFNDLGEGKSAFWIMCAAELAMLGLFTLNVLQAAIALMYPPKPLPLTPSPSKSIKTPQSQLQKRRHVLSPHTSPQPQRTFSPYVSSPVSTPSRTLQYSIPGPTPPPFSSLNSSTGMPQTPSPLSAYRGKHSASIGHAFNGSILSRLTKDDEEDEE